jgi:hypothetical protein
MTYLETLTRRALRASIQPNGKIWIEPDWLITDDIRRMVYEHRDELVQEIRTSSASTDPSQEIVPDYRFLMVATDLDSWEADDPRFGYEVMLDVCYRQLDAPYYAWLRQRMENARGSHDAGRLDDAMFDALRERFNVAHEWAVRRIGEDALRRAIRTTNVKTYVAPSKQTFASYRKTWDDAWEAYERRRVASNDQPGTLGHALATRGYAVIRSGVVDDIVVFVRDDSVAVPIRWSSKVRFTMNELSLMVGSSPEAVKRVYEVKRVFGGKVVAPGDDPVGGTQPAPMPAVQQQLFAAAAAASA